MYQRANHNRFQIFSTLVLPIAIGLGLFMLLSLMIEKQVLTNELLLRYLVGHPISKCTTLLFLIGLAALTLIANNVFDQFCNCEKISLDLEQESQKTKRNNQNSIAEKANRLLESLHEYKWSLQTQYLWQRLASALSFIKRTESIAGIEDELKYLSEMDRDRQQHRYSLVRILIWATPMLGFLGTVLGISQALGGIQVGPDNDFQQMLNSLRGSLFVAFDTTALALTLSIILMFCQFFIDRFESQLIDIVDRRTHEELSPIYGSDLPTEPQAMAIQQVGKSLLNGAHDLMLQQNELWEKSLKSSEAQWAHSISDAHRFVHERLHESMAEASQQLSTAMAETTLHVDGQLNERFADWQKMLEDNSNKMNARWEQWQVMLSDNARTLSQSQALVSEQLQLTREVLTEMNMIQQLLAEKVQQSVSENVQPDVTTQQDDTENEDREPTLRVIPYEQAANRLNHIYRFVTKATVADAG